MARPTNRNTRRAEIAQAMLMVMAERGFDAASIGAVARQAGLAPGLIHYHFGNKEEILEAAVTALVASHDAALEQALVGTTAPGAYLDKFVSLHLELRDGSPSSDLALWQVVLAEGARRPGVAAILTAGESRWRERLAEPLRALGHQAPDSAAAGILAIVRGYLALAATSPSMIPPGSAVRVARTLLRSMTSEGAA